MTKSKNKNNDDFLKLSKIFKSQIKNNHSDFIESLSKITDKKYVYFTEIFTPLSVMVKNKDIANIKLLFEKHDVKSLDDHERKNLNDLMFLNTNKEIFDIFIKADIHVFEDDYLKKLFEKPHPDFLLFMLDSFDYFKGILIEVQKTATLKVLSENNKDDVFVEYLDIIKNDKNGDKIINISWDDDGFKKEILIKAKSAKFKLLDGYKPKDISWKGTMINLYSFSFDDFFSSNKQLDNFHNFLENCKTIPGVQDELNNTLNDFQIIQDDFYKSMKNRVQEIGTDKFEISMNISAFGNKSIWGKYLNLGVCENLCMHQEYQFRPANLTEMLLYSASQLSSFLASDDDGEKMVAKALSHIPIALSFTHYAPPDTLVEVLSKVNNLDDWKDSSDNNLAHYFLSLGKPNRSKKDMSNLRPVIEKYPNWFMAENNISITPRDLVKVMFEEDALPVFDMMVQNSYMKKNIKPKAPKPFKHKKF